MRKVIIMAGGTGGHVFPGIAIAKKLLAQNIKVVWLGSIGGMETELIPAAGIKLHALNIKGFRGKNWRQKLMMPFLLASAIKQSYQILKQEQPDIVLGMGGFVAAPGGIAAKIAGIPLIIHEQNSIAGLTNKLLAKIASRVLSAFPKTFDNSSKVTVTGNPVRADIADLPDPNSRLKKHNLPIKLLIFGGSLGAQIFNELIPQAIAQLPVENRPEIWHQTGQKQFDQTAELYKKLNISANVMPFINNMASAYDWADVVICRAGALTLAELTSVGIASVLVPYPYAVDDHQTHNAQFLVDNHAAILIPQKNFTVATLQETILELSSSKEKIYQLAQAARTLRQEQAVDLIIQQCSEASRK